MLFFFNSAPSGCKGGGFILPLLLLRQKHFTQSESFLAWIAHMYFKINALFHSSNLLMLEPLPQGAYRHIPNQLSTCVFKISTCPQEIS